MSQIVLLLRGMKMQDCLGLAGRGLVGGSGMVYDNAYLMPGWLVWVEVGIMQ